MAPAAVRSTTQDAPLEPLSSVPLRKQGYMPGKGMRPREEAVAASRIDWVIAPTLLLMPVLLAYGLMTVPVQPRTVAFAVVMYLLSGMGITAGYHRLWSHRAYDASFVVRLVLAVFGAMAMEGSCRWWSRNHRAHHKFTDTPKDPYNVRRSFFWAHIGWMLVKQNPREIGSADISDLDADPVLRWQHRHYPALVIGFGVIAPTLVAGLGWGDYAGGFFYAVLARMVFVHHSTFFVNSLAHYMGAQNFSDLHSACDSIVTALVSLGEGYHNFHHEFPADYRNGVKWYHFDPTKWLLTLLYYLGLVRNLRWVSEQEIQKARLQLQLAHLRAKANILEYGPALDRNLPPYTWPDIRAAHAKTGRVLLVIAGKVYDVTDFLDLHPGGRQTLQRQAGNDVTRLFRGDTGEHIHSRFAVDILGRYIVGCVADA